MASGMRTRSSVTPSPQQAHDPFIPGRVSSTPTTMSKGPLTGRPSSPKAAHGRQAHAQSYVGSMPTSLRSQLPILASITALALFIRLYRLGQPSSVVFDEVHFGGFASKYINRKFFMDVHPPLAKMLIAGTARLAGFDGSFNFKDIAKEYLIGENTPVPYVAMRLLPALLGVALVPLAYLTLRALSLRVTTAIVGSLLVLLDNALATQSRLILLDSFLVFFTGATVYCWVEFCNEERRRPFARSWWVWLSATGFFLGCVVSSKWVGLFTIATIGVSTAAQLWAHLGDVRQSMRILFKHFLARALCLIGIPAMVYLTCFAIHLGVLQRSGDGDGFMSSAFQHTLIGHGMPDTYADVALGSTITIRHLNTHGGLLHSHAHSYPAGSKQQQITLYPHSDENNEWYVIKAPGPDDPPTPTDAEGVPLTTGGPHEIESYRTQKVTFLEHNMEVRLVHRRTDKRLHSHEAHRPPITESDFQNEVTGYGFPGFAGDANDNWRVEIEHGQGGDAASSERVRSLRTVFRLRHTLSGCYLFSHKVALPDWGFGQQEVTCNKQPTKPNSLWYVETSTHPRLSPEGDVSLGFDDVGDEDKIAVKPAAMINYLRPSFFSKFWELQKVMWATNAGLTDRHAYDSRPKTWPTLKRGINFWTKDHRQIYLIGNPMVWWGSTVAVAVYLGARALLMLRAKRGSKDLLDSTIVFYDRTAGFLFLGYAMHLAPFFLMSRQLFIHHYLPALYFAILLLALLFDLLTAPLKPRFRLAAASAVVVVVGLTYLEFSPLTYGSNWTQKSCERARWMKSWDFNCGGFPKELKEFATLPPAIHTVEPVVASSGSANSTAALDLGVAQPGQHAFEDQPKKAVESHGIPNHEAPVEVEEHHEGEVVANKINPSAPPPEVPAHNVEEEGGFIASIQTVHMPGDGNVQLNEGGGAKGEQRQMQPEGLDQEMVEEAVLQGTAGLRD